MKISKIKELGYDVEEHDISMIRVLENHYFNDGSCSDYRERAIRVCIKEKFNFTNTHNNTYNMMRNL